MLFSVFVVVLVVVGIYFLVKNKAIDNSVIPEQEVKKDTLILIDPAFSETKTYTNPTAYTTFDVKYPQFKNSSAEFNKKIEDVMQNAIAEHKQISEENWKSRINSRRAGEVVDEFPKDGEKFELQASWKPAQVNADFISILISISAYAGGAHGYENLYSFNYDVKNKKEISLALLFPNDPNYLKTISEFSRVALHKQFRDNNDSMLIDGTEPTRENFNIFTFTPSYITFYFSQYQVGPYVIGSPSVVMPRK